MAQIDQTQEPKRTFASIVPFILIGIFATTLAQPQALGQIPLAHFLKSGLHATPKQSAGFFLLCATFWYLKPLAGILTDSFPIFKTRRRHYALISSILAALSWIALACVPRTYGAVLAAAIIVNLFMVMMSTVTGAMIVEIGQSTGNVGRLTAVRQLAYNFAGLLQGPAGGWFAMSALGLVCGVNAALLLAFFPAAYFFLKEKKVESKPAESLAAAGVQLKIIWKSKTFWWTLVFVFLFFFAPGFGTLQYYRQNDLLKLDQPHIGDLNAFAGFGAIVGTLAYGALTRRLSIRPLLIFGIITASLCTLPYLYYNSWATAIPIDTTNGIFAGFAQVAFIDLAARATPTGCEGLGYSLILSFMNLATQSSNYVGSVLHDSHGWTWDNLVILNAVTTAIVLVLVPFIPKKLLGSRDGLKEQDLQVA